MTVIYHRAYKVRDVIVHRRMFWFILMVIHLGRNIVKISDVRSKFEQGNLLDRDSNLFPLRQWQGKDVFNYLVSFKLFRAFLNILGKEKPSLAPKTDTPESRPLFPEP